MTSCCDDYGKCTRGKECPARPAMFELPQPTPPASLARRANEHIRRLERLEAGRANILALSDAPGNGVDKFLDWFTALPLWQQVCYLFGAVLALGLSAVLLVGPK